MVLGIKKDSTTKVLLVGNNPNILFYTSRFQQGKSIELYHVSDSKSNIYDIETETYGNKHLVIDNHFTSIAHLTEALGETDETKELKLDLIILSAKSLKDLSSMPEQLKPLFSKKTKIVIESSGFIQLESFLRNAKEVTGLDVFAIATNYDIRQVANNHIKEFKNNDNNKNNIYIGGKTTNVSTTKKKNPLSLKDPSKYPSDVMKSLNSLETLLQELFPSDTISNCHKSYTDFLSMQWNMAIPKICLDSLLIIFEETDSKKLVEEVLAKPLISGIITELITISKNMNVKLDPNMENENKLISTWLKEYKSEKIPSLLYTFIQRTSELNLDLLILQPILLADDFNIKTPYLEFLYTTMSQLEKLNNDSSEWFVRAEKVQSYKQQLVTMTKSRDQYSNDFKNLTLDLEKNNNNLNELKGNEMYLKNQLSIRETEIHKLKDEYEIILQEKNREIENLKHSLRNTSTNNGNSRVINSPITDQFVDHDDDNDHNDDNDEFKSIHETSDLAMEGDSSALANSSTMDADRSLTTREQILLQREKELQERQDAFDRRLVSQQRSPQFQSPLQYPTQLQASPALYHNNNTAFSAQPPMHNLPHIRTMTPPDKSVPVFSPYGNNKSGGNTPTMTVDKFVDPISSGNLEMNSSFESPDMRSHPIVRTNRKNRMNRNTTLGNASSTSLGAVMNQMPNNGYMPDRSFSGNSTTMNTSGTSLNMMKSKNNNGIDMPRPTKLHNFTGSPDLYTPTKPNKPEMFKDSSANTTTISSDEVIIKKPVMQFGLGIHSQTELVTPLDKTTIPTNMEPTPFNGSHNVSKEDVSNDIEEAEANTSKDSTKKKKLKFGLFGKKKNKDKK
ncbi:similar to Saccharomyces cerevisiae YDR251W PAM1 Essential protein of unknown function [Maudiozyma barnettii]|uniref:Ketopantoate reductase C-terminal domain-containing protein n=1 Tax=Maudiozyma barnettii TaxID=61262 RepID=A0A8H2VGB6_9SACH|nr:Pam1p [Kazachstania barnettii]CAB4255050.1 similar to Saccharomyces cerevisiae YDR251W PAM1 Essential protein of unknown function [Kazachstania barnettii]CAD1783321.1 similar to Saccharomyces cerevisiae YDR251W PAM1 Essential protein of unknown function [Kazachstania barnettii]